MIQNKTMFWMGPKQILFHWNWKEIMNQKHFLCVRREFDYKKMTHVCTHTHTTWDNNNKLLIKKIFFSAWDTRHKRTERHWTVCDTKNCKKLLKEQKLGQFHFKLCCVLNFIQFFLRYVVRTYVYDSCEKCKFTPEKKCQWSKNC